MIVTEQLRQIRLVCTDIDGTILNSKGCLSPRTKAAVKKVMQKGIPVVLVSARPPRGVSCFYEELGITAPVCAYSGGYLETEGKVLFDRTMPLDVCETICQEAQKRGIHAGIYEGRHWFVQQMDAAAKWEADAIGFCPDCVPYEQLFCDFHKTGHAPNKILCIGDAVKIAAFQHEIALEYQEQLDCYLSKDTYLEIMPKGVTKVCAVKALCKQMGIGREQVLAFGDHFNDLSMLQYAGVGVAVSNAPDDVKKAADWVSSSNDEDGVAVVLEQLLQAE
jgi:Cof subfamily protein (haloacid dehalogenase superfamily)